MKRQSVWLVLWLCVQAGCYSPSPSSAQSAAPQGTQASGAANEIALTFPIEENSTRFAVIGDSGTGDQPEYDVAHEMETSHQKFPFDFVIMLGDNIYGGHSPQDFISKFEKPFKPLLDRGIKFYASLGNHDDPNQERLYKPFNMNGERYYAFSKGEVEFFALDSNYMDPAQLSWLDQKLHASTAKWKICYFHHPLFSEGKHHGSDLDLRAQLLPILQRYGVNVVFSGHEHVYERMKPQDNIYFFVLGNSAKLMTDDFHRTSGMDKWLDTDRAFMLVEVSGEKLYFQTISREGETVDSGTCVNQISAAAATASH